MKICKKCLNPFKSSTRVDGKHYSLTGRSYCLDCSPLFKRNGYKLRKLKTREHLKGGKICPVCKNQKKKYTKNNVCSTCRNALLRYKNKTILKKKAGGKCAECGDDRIDILHFHHKDPHDKKFNISSGYSNKQFKLVEQEASKCILLCPNCHALLHLKDIDYILQYYKCGILDSNQ